MNNTHVVRILRQYLLFGPLTPFLLLIIVCWPGFYLFQWVSGWLFYFPFLAACQTTTANNGPDRYAYTHLYGPYSEEFKSILAETYGPYGARADPLVPRFSRHGALYFPLRFYNPDNDLEIPWHGSWKERPYNMTINAAAIILERRLQERDKLPTGDFLRMHVLSGLDEYYGHWRDQIDQCPLVEALIRKDGLLAHPLGQR